MTEPAAQSAASARTRESTPPAGTMTMCPMARMCMGMTAKRSSNVLLMLPGISLIAVGVLILIEPKALVWLIAMGSLLLGFVLLAMASFIRKMGTRLDGVGSGH